MEQAVISGYVALARTDDLAAAGTVTDLMSAPVTLRDLWGSRPPHLPLSSGIGARERFGMIAAVSLQLRMPIPVWDPNPRA